MLYHHPLQICRQFLEWGQNFFKVTIKRLSPFYFITLLSSLRQTLQFLYPQIYEIFSTNVLCNFLNFLGINSYICICVFWLIFLWNSRDEKKINTTSKKLFWPQCEFQLQFHGSKRGETMQSINSTTSSKIVNCPHNYLAHRIQQPIPKLRVS